MLAPARGLRPVAFEALHVTLCFLGSQDVDEIDAIAAACKRIALTVPRGLSLGSAIWLPERRPRVVAVTVEDACGELASLQASLSQALHTGGWYEPEGGPFLAHVTVARIARGARVRAVELPPPAPLPLRGPRVTLLRSRPGRGGTRYEPLAS